MDEVTQQNAALVEENTDRRTVNGRTRRAPWSN